MTPSHVVGVDVGTTRTRAVVVTTTGEVVGRGEAGGGNPLVGGEDAFRAALARSLSAAGGPASAPVAATIGVAGFNWASQRSRLEDMSRDALGCGVAVLNDAALPIHAASRGWGVSLVAGTSCNCHGVGPSGATATTTGVSMLDEGAGGAEIVLAALRAVARAETGRGPATSLTNALLERSGQPTPDALFEAVARRAHADAAGWAAVVFDQARRGDPVADGVIRWAAATMADLVLGVARKVGLLDADADVVLSGGVIDAQADLLVPLVRAEVGSVAPGALVERLAVPPVAGAVVHALRWADASAVAIGRFLDGVGVPAGTPP